MKTHHALSLAALALGASLCLPSCLIGSSQHTDSSGTYIGEATFARVGPGDEMEFVRELFGPPTQEIPTGHEDGVIWKWSYQNETRNSGSVFLVLSANTTKRIDGSVYVEFENGVVVKSWRDVRADG